MKRIVSMILLMFVANMVNAQLSNDSKPFSYGNKEFEGIQIKTIEVEKPDLEEIIKEDELDDELFKMRRFGVVIPVGVDFFEEADRYELDNGSLYLLKIRSEDAQALSLYSSDFYIPNGGELHLYNSNKTRYIGGFTSINNHELNTFATEMLESEEIVMEYFHPNTSISTPRIEITEIGYAYRDFEEKAGSFGSSGSCNVNVNCSEGDNYRDAQRGVVLIQIKLSSYYIAWCSGSLVNNTRQDLSPYLLTAAHCVESVSSESYYSQFVFYFNYESSSCSNPYSESQIRTTKSLTGGVRKAIDNTYSSNGSDFLLLLLNNNVPESYNAYWNGWDIRNTPASSGVSIHHPSGDIKKISTFTSQLISIMYNSETVNNNGAHWKVKWVRTSTNYGITEGGSSGSPLFNTDSRIVGTLTGGYSSCNTPDNYKFDYYGKMSYHWESNGSLSSRQLKPWLDPDNLGYTMIGGADHNGVSSIHDLGSINSDIILYPNPTSSDLNIEIANNQNEVRVEILNQLGQVLIRDIISPFQTQKTLSLNSLSAGAYIVRLVSNEEVSTMKLVVN